MPAMAGNTLQVLQTYVCGRQRHLYISKLGVLSGGVFTKTRSCWDVWAKAPEPGNVR